MISGISGGGGRLAPKLQKSMRAIWNPIMLKVFFWNLEKLVIIKIDWDFEIERFCHYDILTQIDLQKCLLLAQFLRYRVQALHFSLFSWKKKLYSKSTLNLFKTFIFWHSPPRLLGKLKFFSQNISLWYLGKYKKFQINIFISLWWKKSLGA